MAYKFQLGAAVLSGSIKAEDGLVATDVDDTTAANIVAQIDAGEIPIAKLAEKTISGKDLGTNLDDLSLAANSGLAISGNYNGSAAVSFGLSLDSLAAAAVNVGADSIAIYDADEDATGKESIADLATAMAGAGLAAASGVFSVDIDELSALGSAALHQTQDHFMFSDNGTEKKITFSNLQDAVFADVSGDVAVAAGGAATIQADAVEGSMLNDNVISGQTELAHADIVAADELMVSDGGVLKKVGLDSLGDFYYGNVSGDATIADGGALTIGAAAVEGTMLNVNTITGQTALASGAAVAAADELLISDADAGSLKRVDAQHLADFIYSNVSGDATIASGGALTIANDSVESGMLNDNIISGQAELASGSALAATDELLVSDAGVLKRIDAQHLGDFVYSNVSGDATIASGGALTIANDAVEQAMIADDAVGADQLASNAVVNASVASNAAIALSKIDTNVDMGGAFTIGSQSDDVATFSGGLIVAGDLTVQGSTTTVDSTTINISSSFTFEGPADDHETVLSCATPSADTTLNLPTLSAGTYFIPALADAASDASAAVTAAEFALLDGGSSVGTTALASGDGFLHNDAGTMKHTSIDKLADFFAGAGLSSASGVMALDIDELSELSEGPHASEDMFAVSDNGTEKKVSMTNVANGSFALVSGDVLIASGGAATIQASSVEGSMFNNNVISGQSDIGADIVATDEILISDAGVVKRTDMSRIKTYIGSGKAAINAIGDANATLAVGVNAPSANASAGRTWTLPASAGLEVGESIVIKAYGNAGAQPLTIAQAGSQEIDGSTANLVLESDNAAITLYYVAADTFVIV